MIWNREVETAPRAGLRALQAERLRATVARARARVPRKQLETIAEGAIDLIREWSR